MLNKKIAKILVLSAIGILGLTACDEIIAKPTDYDSKLVNFDTEVYHNVASVVYDAIREGGVGDDVLDEVLYRFSQSVIGFYSRNVVPAPSADEVTLEECYEELISDSTTYPKTNKFVKSHKAYWTINDDGKRVNDEGAVVPDDSDASQSELVRVWAKWDTIEERIASKMYEKISSGSYSDRSIFSEKKFLMSLRGSMCDVADPLAIGFSGELYEGLLTPDYEPEEVFDAFLHREYYSGAQFHYIERELIPTISKQLLTEQYLLDETYNTLGRSYARKVNIITIKNNEEYPMAADYLANHLVSRINAYPSNDIVTLDVFKLYSNVLIGAPGLSTDEMAIVTDIQTKSNGKVFTENFDITGFPYLEGTEYGDLMKKYGLIKDNPILTDSSAESEFTGNNAYTKETGLEIKTNELSTKKHTTTGWFIKNGGLTELPDSIRSRLFNIGVANGVKETVEEREAVDRWQLDASGEFEYVVPEDENAYVARINGKNYLKTSSRISDDAPEKDILHYDASSKTYYVIQIEEACSSSKLSKTSANSYKETRGIDTMEDIINDVTKQVGTSESYSTLATKFYLEKMALVYHDQSVYDYFKSNYPDLFE